MLITSDELCPSAIYGFSRELGYSLRTHVKKPSKAWFFRYRYLWVNNPWVESYFRGNPRSRPLQRKYSKRFSKKQDNFFERTSISCLWIQDLISRIIVALLENFPLAKSPQGLINFRDVQTDHS